MNKELIDELKKNTVMLVKLRGALEVDLEKRIKEGSALAVDVEVRKFESDFMKFVVDLFLRIDSMTDAMKKQGLAIAGVQKALEQRFAKLEVASDGARKPDKYDIASQAFALRYGPPNGRVAPRHTANMDDIEAARLAQEEIDSRNQA
jgi:hypothetical protein